MDGEVNCDCVLKLNPDITGIGVRVALYIQILLGWSTSLIWPDTFIKNARTAYMTALALIIAGFIELTTQDLSLLDGLVVAFISTMMITFAIASYSRIPGSNESNDDGQEKSADDQKSFSRWLMQGCFVVFWGAWCFNMWRDPAHFGLKGKTANCDTNYQIKVQLFTLVSATEPSVRHAALALVAVGFAIALLSLFVTLEQAAAPILWLIAKLKGEKEKPQERGIFKYEDNPVMNGIHFFLQAIAVGIFIFLIYATERTISANDFDSSTRDWSYGQTIALILLLQQIMDIFSTYIEEKEKSQKQAEQSAAAHAAAHGDYPGGLSLEMPNLAPNPNDANGPNTAPTTPSSK